MKPMEKIYIDPRGPFTAQERQAAHRMVQELGADNIWSSASSLQNDVRLAVNALCGPKSFISALKTEVIIKKNDHMVVPDAFFEGSENLDAWIKATARVLVDGEFGYADIGVFLTDIWHWVVPGSEPNNIHTYAYFKRYVDVERKSPCEVCGYRGEHLDAPPCTACPATPKKKGAQNGNEI